MWLSFSNKDLCRSMGKVLAGKESAVWRTSPAHDNLPPDCLGDVLGMGIMSLAWAICSLCFSLRPNQCPKAMMLLGAILTWAAYTATWGHRYVWVHVAPEGHVWVCGPIEAWVCVDVHDAGYHWRPYWGLRCVCGIHYHWGPRRCLQSELQPKTTWCLWAVLPLKPCHMGSLHWLQVRGYGWCYCQKQCGGPWSVLLLTMKSTMSAFAMIRMTTDTIERERHGRLLC